MIFFFAPNTFLVGVSHFGARILFFSQRKKGTHTKRKNKYCNDYCLTSCVVKRKAKEKEPGTHTSTTCRSDDDDDDPADHHSTRSAPSRPANYHQSFIHLFNACRN